MRKYSKYKDSEIEWIGEIPAEWELIPLFIVCHQTHIKNESNSINVLSLSYGKIIKRDLESNFGLLPDNFDTYQIIKNGFTILRLTDLQNDKTSLRVGFCQDEGIITSAYLSISPIVEELDNKFLYLQLHSSDLKKVFYTLGGGLRQTMRFEDLRRFPIILPSLLEQKLIVSFLDQKTSIIDSLIKKKLQKIELLKEQRISIINQAVTKGLNSEVSMKDSGVEWIGEMPADWEIGKLNHICSKITNGYVGPTRDIMIESGVGYIQGIHVKNREIIFTPDGPYYVSEEWSNAHSKSILQEGDVLVVQTGSIGETAYVTKEFEGYNCHALIIIRLKYKYGIGKFLSYFIMSNYVRSFFRTIKTGDILEHLNTSRIQDMKVCLPAINEQEKIVKYLDKRTYEIDKQVDLENRKIDLLKEYRQSLISEVVTGKIDVRTN